jgi:FkbM family methyltransferase
MIKGRQAMVQLHPSRIASIVYNTFIFLSPIEKKRWIGKIWWRAWQKSCLIFDQPIQTSMHGQKVIVNYGYTYPFFIRKFPHLNNPLVEITHLAYKSFQRPVNFVDVGAAVGDTVLLIAASCPDMVKHFYCIDGDPEFFGYLQHNLAHLTNVSTILGLVSSQVKNEPALVRTHQGTASAQGSGDIVATTLDIILAQADAEHIDILKIDVDGFDGKVLAGCQDVLYRDHPFVIFEWHPILCRQTSNSWLEHFETLTACGYSTFVWFTKYGEWSHITHGYDQESINGMADLSLKSRIYADWHYDIVALPTDVSSQVVLELAETTYAKQHRSRF